MRRKIIIATLLAGISAGYFLLSGTGTFTAPADAALEAANDRPMAPDFELTNMQGEIITLSQYRGKVVLLNFWASWCPPCRAEMPAMEELYQTMKGSDFVMLAVNVEEDGFAAAERFLEEVPVTFPILLDPAQTAAGLYRVHGLPQTFIIDREGRIVEQVMGARDWHARDVVEFLSTLTKGD